MVKFLARILSSLLRRKLGKLEYTDTFKRLSDLSAEGLCYGNDHLINQAELNLVGRVGPELSLDDVVMDIGANNGEYAKSWLPYTQKIIAFEPGKKAFNELESENGKLFSCENLALGSEEKDMVTMYQEYSDSRLNSLHPRKHKNHQWLNKESVQMTTLDSYCKEKGIRHITFLKIDVEGHELEVLRGATHMLKHISYLQFEFGGAHIDSKVKFKDLFEILSPYFQLHYLLLDGLKPIQECHEKLENYRGNNFLAVAKLERN